MDGTNSNVERIISANDQLYALVNAGPARLFRYDGGSSWTQISNDLTANWKSSGTETVGIAFGNGQFYVAPRLGKVFSLPLAGGSWADMSQGLPTEPGEPSAQSALTIAPDGTLFLVVNPAYNQIFRRAAGASSWTQILGYSYGAGDFETLVHSSDTLWMGGNRQLLKVQGSARVRLDTYSASGVELPGRVKAIATDDDGRTIFVAARSENGLGQSVYRMVVNPNLPMQNNNLPASTASYLGNGPSPDEANAVEIGLDSGVVVAGRSERVEPCVACSEFGVATTLLLGGGNGMLVRLDASGRQVRSVTRIGQQINDMEINRSSGEIALATDFGLALLNASADRVLWQRAVAGGVRRIAVGNDGTVAAINADVVTTYDSSGNQRGQRRLEGRFVEDVAVDAASQSVFVGGYRNDRLPNGVPVQVAYLWSFDYGLAATKWQNWSYPGSALTGNEADTRLYRVAMGRDGLLYITGESAGGNGIYRWQPRTLGAPAPNVEFDAFNKIDMLRGAAHIGYYARLNPADGTLLAGQFIVARLGDNFGNTFRPRAIAADELGYVYVGGEAASAIDNRNFQQIAGKPVGPYSGDSTVLVAAPNLRARMYWTTWNGGNNANATVRAVAAGNGVAAAAFVATRGNLIIHEPLPGQGGPSAGISSGNPDAHFSVWPGFRR
ncbi:MAG: hypothetical protein MUD01_28810 [Chloroflexaceae bacterium]|nr:hypothetical protein [Chloroflexaceae bacterium]